MELKDTIEMMNSNDYKERFKAEYNQTKIRRDKLHNTLIQQEAGVLNFELKCDPYLLKKQECAMDDYLRLLEIRAAIEKIDL